MDSGNSGSLQSSSGGDEEFNSSRADHSLTAYLNSSNSNHNMGIMSSSHQQLPLTLLQQHPSHHQHPSTLFDPLSNYLDAFSQSSTPNSTLNLDMVWPRGASGHAGGGGLRSDPNNTQPGGGGLPGLPSSSSSAQAIPNTQQPLGRNPFPDPSSKPLPSGPDNGSRPSASSDPNNVPRNTKKRSRASRRAPTTVLTTDKSNFRAMVQEFTGIPAPPFSATPFPRTRLDLFSNASNMRSSFDPSSPQPPYLSRPFAHKFQPPSFVSSTIASTTNSAAINSTNTAPAPATNPTNVSNSNSTNNYQLSSDQLGLPRQQSETLLNMQNPMPTFQSLLQSPPKYSSSNVPIFGSKPPTHEPIPSSEDFGMSHGHLGTLSSLVSTGGGLSLSRNDNWGEGVGSNDANQTHLRSINGGNYGTNPQRVTSCKMNFSASSSDFHTEKAPENVSTRGEGMVDSWICSSD